MEKIVFLGISPTHADQIHRIAAQLHLRTMEILPEAYRTPLGTLIGYTTMRTTSTEIPMAESIASEGILLLCGLKNNQIDRLLTKLQQAGLQSIYKAVLTPTNAGWNALQLSYELQRERKKMES